ncbi:homeobox goosecoid, partial [Brachionus plicatilis]
MSKNNNLDILLCKSQPPVRQRRQRTNFTEEVIEKLEEFFLKNPYPDINEREQMAKLLCTNEDRVQVWFQNKRARYRKRVQKENNQTVEPSKITKKNKINLDKTPEPVKTTNDSGYSSFSFQSPCLADLSFNYNPVTHPIYNHYNQSTPNALRYHMYFYNQMSPVVNPKDQPIAQPRHNQ